MDGEKLVNSNLEATQYYKKGKDRIYQVIYLEEFQ